MARRGASEQYRSCGNETSNSRSSRDSGDIDNSSSSSVSNSNDT